jgi:hypothetical protein
MGFPDPELVAAVDEAMFDALADRGPMLRAAAADSPLLKQGPTAEEIIERMRRNRLDDPETPSGLPTSPRILRAITGKFRTAPSRARPVGATESFAARSRGWSPRAHRRHVRRRNQWICPTWSGSSPKDTTCPT